MQSLADKEQVVLNHYDMFTYSIGNELTRKYYERRLKKFFDYIAFDTESDLGERCNSFARSGVNDGQWVLNQIVSFLQYQKGRVQKGEIAAATLKNFVKTIKLFCEMSDVHIPWKKITRGLPRARAAANDRVPTVEEIQKLVEYPDRRIKAIVSTMVDCKSSLSSTQCHNCILEECCCWSTINVVKQLASENLDKIDMLLKDVP